MSDLAKARNFDEFMEGIWRQNPVFVMVLGMCPTLAVTVSALNALSMGLATMFVLVCSCGLVSLMRSLEVYDALGAFIQLIVVNCIILGRAEAHASKTPPVTAMVNALGMSIGFVIGLFALGAVREILGAGTLFGVSLFGPNFQPWVVMVLPPGGFIVLGAWLLLFAALKRRKEARLAAQGGGHGA